MTKNVFEKIKAGLEDALRMIKEDEIPTNNMDQSSIQTYDPLLKQKTKKLKKLRDIIRRKPL